MADWQSKIDLKDLWTARNEGKLTIKELASGFSDRIRSSNAWGKFGEDAAYELEEIADAFRDCEDDVEEFDSILSELYDWGDFSLDRQRKRCWISTVL